MNSKKNKMDLAQVMVTDSSTGRQVMGREAIRAAYPMKTSGPNSRDRDLYHVVTYPAAGTTQIVCFGEAVGQNGVKLDKTNMEKAGEFGKGKDQFVEGFNIIPLSAAATEADRLADLTKLLNKGRLVVVDEDGKEVYSVFPLRRVVSDLSLNGLDTTHGNSIPREPHMLRNPFNIEEGQRFSVNLDFPNVAPVLTADVTLTVMILGQEHKAALRR